ncbi:kelch-like protein 10 [Neosynchiropus ocellatus]
MLRSLQLSDYDAFIVVEKVKFPVHKLVLSNCSSYFHAFFERWSAPRQTEFTIKGISATAMQQIIKYAYTNSICLTQHNVRDLLRGSDYVNISKITAACIQYLEEILEPKNCIKIWQFSKTIHSCDLHQKIYKYILCHFEELVFSDGFTELTVQELMEILENDTLIVREESTVFEAISFWIAHEPNTRSGHITDLLPKVRLALLSLEYISVKVRENSYVKRDNVAVMMVDNGIKIINHYRRKGRSVPGSCDLLARPRLPSGILLAIGGWSCGLKTTSIEAYDLRVDRWVNLTIKLQHHRDFFGAAFLNGNVYCLGGTNGFREYLKTVQRYNMATHAWQDVPPMHCRRFSLCVTTLNGCIYALGGFNGENVLKSAERYKPEENEWRLISCMHQFRSQASCTTLHNKIYVCGGFNGRNRLRCAEHYNPEADQWTLIRPMMRVRRGLGVFSFADHVFAVGGHDEETLRCVEAFNPKTNTWHTMFPMIKPRVLFSVHVVEERVFAVGGTEGSILLGQAPIEYYDAKSRRWLTACPMNKSRWGMSCCVVTGIPNIIEYIVPRDSLPPLKLGPG